MPPPIPVVLFAYNPDWPRMAAAYAERLQVLGPTLVTVHHIGSTSVPGLAAKPIIDLMPVVTSLADLDRERPRVEALGYNWYGELGISGRRYCTLSDKAGNRIVQLHCFSADSPEVERHIAFRDYLRAHPDSANAYEKEKRRARDLHPYDSHAYTDEKTAWIRDTELKALVWFAEQSRIVPGDFKDERVLALLRTHLAAMHTNSPPGSVYALDLSGLQSDDVSFYTAWEGETLVGMGAIKRLSPTTAEIKSMRTHADYLRQGVAARILDHLLAVARSRGYRCMSLETGSGDAFEPALALYRRYGFVNGEAFGDYKSSDFNQFLHLAL
jgi:GrpB-like predicted nucleotidyltransferase (UPF0157 family)